MREGIHPEYRDITVTCSCGNSFSTRSTLKKNLHIEICSACHPFYVGGTKIIDTLGRVDKFKQKFGGPKGKKENKGEAESATKS